MHRKSLVLNAILYTISSLNERVDLKDFWGTDAEIRAREYADTQSLVNLKLEVKYDLV